MALTFVTTATAPAGTPLHVSVYDGAGNLIDPTSGAVTWSGLGASITVTPDSAGGAGGFVFNTTAVTVVNAVAHDGVAAGTLTLSFTAPPLKFTTP